MKRGRGAYRRLGAVLRRFGRDDEAATLVEFAVVLPLFLLVFMAMVDFGRMAFHYVAAERAMQVASRIAAVRPPACPGVPQWHERGPAGEGTPPEYGTSCRAGPDVCLNAGTVACSGNAANATAAEVWGLVQGALPVDAAIANLAFSYTYDPGLGFLGGPYVPVVTVEVQDLTFDFISPLGRLAALAGASGNGGVGPAVPFPPMSVSMPGEDLAQGNNG